MNLGQMAIALQRYGFDTTDPLTVWLNAAMHELESAFDYPWQEEGPVTFVLPAGANTFSLPSDTDKLITVRDTTNLYDLKYWGRRKFNRMIQDQTDPGLPEVYTLVGQTTLQFWRVPVSNVNIEVLYSASSPDMAVATDVPNVAGQPWPLYMHYPIVMRAASIALQAENEEERAKQAQSEYERALLHIAATLGERELGDVETVEDVQGYGTDMPIRGLGGR